MPGTSDVVDARSHIMDALSNRRSRARRRSCLRLGALLRTTAAGAVEPRAREEIRVGVSVPRLFELLYCHVFQELSNKKEEKTYKTWLVKNWVRVFVSWRNLDSVGDVSMSEGLTLKRSTRVHGAQHESRRFKTLVSRQY